MTETVACRRCGAPTRLVIEAETRRGMLVNVTPRRDYIVIGSTDTGVPLVRWQETWVPHFLTCPHRPPSPTEAASGRREP